METLTDIKADAKDVLLAMRSIGKKGPSEENAKLMLDKMEDLQDIVDRIDNIPE